MKMKEGMTITRIQNKKTVAFYTLGCKLNYAETSTIARSFEEKGYEKVEFTEQADVYVINTCSVTQLADKKCRHIISKANRVAPGAIIAVVGCYAQLKPGDISLLDGVNIVLGTKDKFSVADRIETYQSGNPVPPSTCCENLPEEFHPSYSLTDRTRSFLKVQDGCDYLCSYCTIPMARGKSRNAPISEIVSHAREIRDRGAKEIVLTGINIGDFGRSTGESFLHLLEQLDQVDGIDRYRISSIEPNLIDDTIIDFISRSRRFMPHFHIPLQSGSDKILRLMRRRYLSDIFANRVKKIREMIPDACIGADVIVGFPGETIEDFDTTRSFIESLDIQYLHVFPYSERPGTPSTQMPGKVSPTEKEERVKILIALGEEKKQAFYNRFKGTSRPVLFESTRSKGMMSGFTDNYIKVEIPYQKTMAGQIAMHLI